MSTISATTRLSKRVLVSSRSSDQIYAIDPRDHDLGLVWPTGYQIALIRAAGDRLVAASLDDGVLVGPKAAARTHAATHQYARAPVANSPRSRAPGLTAARNGNTICIYKCGTSGINARTATTSASTAISFELAALVFEDENRLVSWTA